MNLSMSWQKGGKETRVVCRWCEYRVRKDIQGGHASYAGLCSFEKFQLCVLHGLRGSRMTRHTLLLAASGPIRLTLLVWRLPFLREKLARCRV
jgi:hypothetical protein